jgi:hypothetical protein
MKETKAKIFNIITYLTFFSAFIMIATITFWLTYPYKTLEVNKEPIKIVTPVVGKSTPLIYEIDYCKFTDKVCEVQKSYVNDITFPASITQASNFEGCRVARIAQVVPYELPSGTYRLKIAFTYYVNPIREITVIAHTEPFKVIERD